MASDTTEFGAPVPTAEYKFFKENFPQYGAVKWFITSALLNFNEQVRANPTAKEHIERSIEQMVETNRLIAQAVAAGSEASHNS